jgi:hypothetical protein
MIWTTAAFDHREIAQARAWVKRQRKAGRSVASECNNSDTYLLISFNGTLASIQPLYEAGLNGAEAFKLRLLASPADL